MNKPYIMHMFTPTNHLSPFDVNMVLDEGWDNAIAYTSVELNDVETLVQDTIFSRGKNSLQQTGIFIGGRDIFTAVEMFNLAHKAMVPPFEISIFADPSGAYTTAASMIACTQQKLKTNYQTDLKGKKVLSLGGTGPLGIIVAALACQAGADVTIISRSLKRAEGIAMRCKKQLNCDIQAGDEETKRNMLGEIDVIFACAAPGVVVFTQEEIRLATQLKIAVDANAVPPSGIHGVDLKNDGVAVKDSPSGALGIGALVIGDVKYHTHHNLLKLMRGDQLPIYLNYGEAAQVANEYLANKG